MDVKLECFMRLMDTKLTIEKERHEREIAAVKSEMREMEKQHEKELAEQEEEMQCKMAELKVTSKSSTLSLCRDHTPSE